MANKKDFKTRLKIAKSNLKNNNAFNKEKKSKFVGEAVKRQTELVAEVVMGEIIVYI